MIVATDRKHKQNEGTTHSFSFPLEAVKKGNNLLRLIEFCFPGYGTRANDKKSKGITESADEDTRKGQGRPSFFLSLANSLFSQCQ